MLTYTILFIFLNTALSCITFTCVKSLWSYLQLCHWHKFVCVPDLRSMLWGATMARAAWAVWSVMIPSLTAGQRWLQWKRQLALQLWPALMESCMSLEEDLTTTLVQTRWEADGYSSKHSFKHAVMTAELRFKTLSRDFKSLLFRSRDMGRLSSNMTQ